MVVLAVALFPVFILSSADLLLAVTSYLLNKHECGMDIPIYLWAAK